MPILRPVPVRVPVGSPVRRRTASLVVTALLVGACSSGAASDETAAGSSSSVPPSTEVDGTDRSDGAEPSDEPSDGSGGPDAGPGRVVEVLDTSAPDGTGPTTHRIEYSSMGTDGKPITVTGTVTVPAAEPPPGGYPVVGFGHGTTGMADECAPSHAGQPAYYLDDLVAGGYVVASSDYEGLGSPGLHPYLVGESEGRSILDIVRAAGELAPTSGEVVLFGHSQGGHAVLFAAEMAPEYAPELEVLGVAPIAAPSNLDGGTASALTPLQTSLSVMLVASYGEAYDFDAAALFRPEMVERLAVLEEGCVVDVVGAFSLPPDEVYADVDEAVRVVARYGSLNNPGRVAPAAPVLLVQGAADDLVTPDMADRILTDYCAAGATVELALYEGADHVSVVASAETDVLGWLEARFAGESAATSCPA